MDETIMPDGRPLIAWKNELEMLRSKEERSIERLKEAHQLAKLAGIVEIYRKQNPHNLSITLEITLDRLMSSDSADPLDTAVILPLIPNA